MTESYESYETYQPEPSLVSDVSLGQAGSQPFVAPYAQPMPNSQAPMGQPMGQPMSQPSLVGQPGMAQPSGMDFGMFADPSNPMMGHAMNYVGNNVLGSQMENVQSSVSHYMSFLKYYFDVNTAYVVQKLQVILFPLSHKSWKRVRVQAVSGTSYCSPREDVNAPDLYIPLMSFVTFVLLVGFVMGTAYRFTPEVLGSAATTGIALLLLEVFAIKAGIFLLGTETEIPVLDLLSYCGYIFVGTTLNLAVGVILGNTVYYLTLLATSLFMAIFMLRTLRMLVLVDGKVAPEPRTYLLATIFVAQFVIAWMLGMAADWTPNLEAIEEQAAASVANVLLGLDDGEVLEE